MFSGSHCCDQQVMSFFLHAWLIQDFMLYRSMALCTLTRKFEGGGKVVKMLDERTSTSARTTRPAETRCGKVERYFMHLWMRRCITWTHQQARCECSPRKRRRPCVEGFMQYGRGVCNFSDPVSGAYTLVWKANKTEEVERERS